jgi:hypothetical protein
VLFERLRERELVAAGGRQLELRRLIPDPKHMNECIHAASVAGLAGDPPAMTLP